MPHVKILVSLEVKCIAFGSSYVTKSGGTSVSIVYVLDDLAIEVRTPAEARGLFL
jgi:hypothetical protein